MATAPKLTQISTVFKADDSEDTIIANLDKLFLVSLRSDPNSADFYRNFDNQLNIYLDKISGKSKDVVKNLIDRKVVQIGLNPKKNTNVLGRIVDVNNKLLYIILDQSSLDIDIDGTIGNIEETINAIYYQFIRFIALTNTTLKKNEALNALIIKYYSFLLIKVLKLGSHNDKTVELIKYIVGVMYYKCFLGQNVTLGSEKTLKLINPHYVADFEASIDLKLIEKYSDIKDILKLFIDFKITTETPNTLTYNLLMGLKTTSFISITNGYDLLLAGIITSLYSQEFYKHLLINQQIQSQIENIVSQCFDDAKYEKTDKLHIVSTTKAVTNGKQ
jgi:hypothetical protein